MTFCLYKLISACAARTCSYLIRLVFLCSPTTSNIFLFWPILYNFFIFAIGFNFLFLSLWMALSWFMVRFELSPRRCPEDLFPPHFRIIDMCEVTARVLKSWRCCCCMEKFQRQVGSKRRRFTFLQREECGAIEQGSPNYSPRGLLVYVYL